MVKFHHILNYARRLISLKKLIFVLRDGETNGDYNVLLGLFGTRTFDEHFIKTPLFEPMLKVHRNMDWSFCCDIQELQDNGHLEYKSRRFYNYVLCKKSVLLNMRGLGDETIDVENLYRENYTTALVYTMGKQQEGVTWST